MRVKTARDLGNMIHDQRRSLGLTQAQLAARVGASRLWVNQVEAGHGGAALSRVLGLLSALGLSVNVSAQEPSVVPAPKPSSVSPRAARTGATDPRAGRKMAMPKARPVRKKDH